MPIRWTELAARNLTQICDHLEEHSNERIARRVALPNLSASERVDRIPRERPTGKAGTRELILSAPPHLALYRLRNGAVEVLRILHGAQNWPLVFLIATVTTICPHTVWRCAARR
jgi:toxin ParE1/3/4